MTNNTPDPRLGGEPYICATDYSAGEVECEFLSRGDTSPSQDSTREQPIVPEPDLKVEGPGSADAAQAESPPKTAKEWARYFCLVFTGGFRSSGLERQIAAVLEPYIPEPYASDAPASVTASNQAPALSNVTGEEGIGP